jgi:hypothetical protein
VLAGGIVLALANGISRSYVERPAFETQDSFDQYPGAADALIAHLVTRGFVSRPLGPDGNHAMPHDVCEYWYRTPQDPPIWVHITIWKLKLGTEIKVGCGASHIVQAGRVMRDLEEWWDQYRKVHPSPARK